MLGNLFILVSVVAVFAANVNPVDNLDLLMYSGRWYQVIKDRFDMSFQGEGTCAVADYGLTETNVTVLNSQIDKDGKVDQIAGYAFSNPVIQVGILPFNLMEFQHQHHIGYWNWDLL